MLSKAQVAKIVENSINNSLLNIEVIVTESQPVTISVTYEGYEKSEEISGFYPIYGSEQRLHETIIRLLSDILRNAYWDGFTE